jgi:arylsulfatase A-like enzyme
MPNIILLIIDTLRYDRLGISGYRPAVTPHLDALAAGGINCPNYFSNGCVTSFAFPGMFTSSLPFDFGGYDDGISHRPISFPEVLQQDGFETYGLVTGHPCSSHFGYDRGFEHFLDLIDLYQWFRSIYVASLSELITSWQAGKISETELMAVFVPKFRSVLDDTERFITALESSGAPRSGRPRKPLLAAVKVERKLLDQNPRVSLEKIVELQSDYQFALGEDGLSRRTRRRIERRKSLFKRFNKRIHLLSNRRAFDAGEVNKQFNNFLAQRSNRPFFALLHYFDLHEAKLQISKLLARPTPGRINDGIRAYRRIMKDRPPEQRGILYDMGLALVDERLGELRRILTRHGMSEDTILVITGDHGTEAGAPHRGLGSNLPRLFYDEHLHVPLIVNGPGVAPKTIDALSSHLDLAPTILDIAGITPPDVFQGLPIRMRHTHPDTLVWSENAGLGRCDIATKPLYMSVRSTTHRSIVCAENFVPELREFYNLENDPFAKDNLASGNKFTEIRESHLAAIQKRLEKLRAQSEGQDAA